MKQLIELTSSSSGSGDSSLTRLPVPRSIGEEGRFPVSRFLLTLAV